MMTRYHEPALAPNQCGSSIVQVIDAPLPRVWSVIRRFDAPQAYKGFIKSCSLVAGDGGVGSVREVRLISGLPANTSLERLDRLDDDLKVMVVSNIGGDHKLVNYRSTTTLHDEEGAAARTVVIESYVVDVPEDSCEADTCSFADTIIGCNLKSLARITENKKKKAVD
ncbi:unnamed protein product [Linum trigynum]